MVSFGARCHGFSTIQKNNLYTEAKDEFEPVCLIELDPACAEDMTAINDVNYIWHAKEGYPACIFNCMKYALMQKQAGEDSNLKFYAMTTQNKDFENPRGEDILALVQVYTEDSGDKKVEYMQVNPKNSYESKSKSKYKHTGSTMMNFLKEFFSSRKIVLFPCDTKAAKFYEANGFRVSDKQSGEMTFIA